ncbi:hypothetical protein [Streptomyces sp. NPDC051994]|uniref:hypothetical protein n=1 Tax=unclassified Streptomyces TaxID=2593676 RepID=UPI00341C8E18
MPDQPDLAERRTRYAAAMAVRDGDTWPTTYENDEADYLRRADAAMAVADAEMAVLPAPADRGGPGKYYCDNCDHAFVAPTDTESCICSCGNRAWQEKPADRAVVLREAAARYEEILAKANPETDPRYWTAVRDITLGLRRMADEAHEETHVVTDDSDDPEHADDCPGCEAQQPEEAGR